MVDAIQKIGGCRNCGYDLRGLPTPNCPECGRAFDPNDATTVGPIGTRFGPLARWAVARPGWPMWMFTVIVVSIILWYARYPLAVREDTRIYRGLWQVLFTLWGGRLMIQLLMRARLRDPDYRRRIQPITAALVLMLSVGIGYIVKMEGISTAAMKFSRPAFVRLSHSLRAQDRAHSSTQWAGLYPIEAWRPSSYSDNWVYFDAADSTASFTLDIRENELYCHSDNGDHNWMFFLSFM